MAITAGCGVRLGELAQVMLVGPGTGGRVLKRGTCIKIWSFGFRLRPWMSVWVKNLLITEVRFTSAASAAKPGRTKWTRSSVFSQHFDNPAVGSPRCLAVTVNISACFIATRLCMYGGAWLLHGYLCRSAQTLESHCLLFFWALVKEGNSIFWLAFKASDLDSLCIIMIFLRLAGLSRAQSLRSRLGRILGRTFFSCLKQHILYLIQCCLISSSTFTDVQASDAKWLIKKPFYASTLETTKDKL